MNIQLSDFFEYVFGTRATINVDNIPETLKKQKKQEKITAIQKKFEFVTQNEMLSTRFRQTLRQLHSTNLESALYGNNTDFLGLASDDYSFPSDSEIVEEFQLLDIEYGYFAQDTKGREAYIKLFKACKLIADYAECDNTPQNKAAYIHAYKLLVLFGDRMNGVDTYISSYNLAQQSKPVHDLLVQDISKQGHNLKIEAWREFIKKFGPKAIEYFQQATDIQALRNGIPPKNLEEAEVAACQIIYKRFKEHSELARLCVQYHVNEKVFNQCLEIMPKAVDNMPNITIDGASMNLPGYYLMKLPIDDPRAFILGHITNCCQSIGGDSEACVIDGITKPNNGFYVLLKTTQKGTLTPPLVQGKIDYTHYAIVGQGYAWRSKMGNFTFDSWDNLTPSVEDGVITQMLPVFSKKVTEENPEILRVTIGTGGKTPDELIVKTVIENPEKILEGYQYGDSSEQALVYFNQEKGEQFTRGFREKLYIHFHQRFSIEQVTRLVPTVSSIREVAWLEELFLKEEHANFWKEVTKDDKVLVELNNIIEKNGYNFYKIVLVLAEAKILNVANYKRLLSLSADQGSLTDSVVVALQQLKDFNLMTDKNLELLLAHRIHLGRVVQALLVLHKANPSLVNDANFKSLVSIQGLHRSVIPYVAYITYVLSQLHRADPKLVNNESLYLLINNAQHASDIHNGLHLLYKANPRLVNDENFKLFATVGAEHILAGLSILDLQVPSLVNDEHFKLFAEYPTEDVSEIAEGLILLHQTNPILVNDENRKILATYASKAKDIASGLCVLYQADPALVNDENRKKIALSPDGPSKAARYLVEELIKIADSSGLPKPVLSRESSANLLPTLGLFASRESVRIAEAVGLMNEAGIFDLDEYVPVLYENEEHAMSFAIAIVQLSQASMLASENVSQLSEALKQDGVVPEFLYFSIDVLFTQHLLADNFSFVLTHAKDAWQVIGGIHDLHKAGILTPENRTILGLDAGRAEEVANELIAKQNAQQTNRV
jgi:hypothetical protein